MSDTKIERSICEAIEIIADKKIAQASFDKTIKAVVNKCLDDTTGKYEIKYQDSLFQAYATSSEIKYENGKQVYILIPGNDWDRKKTIINGVENLATTFKDVPNTGETYNTVGPNLTNGNANLCSYRNTFRDLYAYGGSHNLITIDQENAKRYIRQSDSIRLGMVVRTELDDSQVGGDYGLIFNLRFVDNVTGDAAVRPYLVTARNVNGNPYGLISPTLVENLIESIDTANFDRVQSVQIFCDGFPQDQDILKDDIFISDILFNGAKALTEEELNGYSLFIDYSENGNVLNQNLDTVLLEAQLKVNGKLITDNVDYYWFRQNGLVFRGHDAWNGYGGDGWECLNFRLDKTIKPTLKNFQFTSKPSKVSNTTSIITALAVDKVTKVKCVAVYNYRNISGQSEVINNNISSSIYITSSDLVEEGVNKTRYYLDAGSPTLTCFAQGLGDNLTYTWGVTPARGKLEKKENTTTLNQNYAQYKSEYENAQNQANNMAPASAAAYRALAEYQEKKNNWENIKDVERIDNNIWYNFPIGSIADYSKITCAVTDSNGEYKGTASITLYNSYQMEGMYNLNLRNGTQVFQYDGKGNSPASKQLDKPLEILPLEFTLLDNQGKEISINQIRNNGHIKWIIPNVNTLLLSQNTQTPTKGNMDLTVLGTDLPLSASSYDVYSNTDSFLFSIAQQYDAKKIYNTIWLNIKYNNMIFNAYTDFTFQKDGDPGTNGTDYVVKLSPSLASDRLYISNQYPTVVFNDNGVKVDKLNFQLYNNSVKVKGVQPSLWTCPPKGTSEDRDKYNTYISSYVDGIIEGRSIRTDSVLTDKPVDIIRAQYTGQGDIKYYAEYPICYNYIDSISGTKYRFKVAPKTGFKYVVYAQDGTSPNYDNTMPFEIVVQKLESGYYVIQNPESLTYEWFTIGQIELDKKVSQNKAFYKPKDKFDGSDLTSAIVVKIKKGNLYLGYIHIPIYMILNRYGHTALNAWDGNSIELNGQGDTILAPQIGAGRKNSDNSFTGVFMGDVKDSSGNDSIGFMGYHYGARSIFLDAETGKAQFGKQGKSQIVLDPTSDKAQLYSGNYSTVDKTGMLIDLTTPQIKFGSGNFSVNKDGELVAKGGGSIAGWEISDDALAAPDKNVYLRSQNYGTEEGNKYAIYSNGSFSVTPEGYLTSTSGKIAKWDINENALSNGQVGMGEGKTIPANTFNEQSSAITNARIWSNNSFAVDANGKIWANEGQIGPWTLSKNQLTDGNTGLGSKTISAANMNTAFGAGTVSSAVAARIWGLGTKGNDATANFVVDNTGKMYSKDGRIGGWTINSTQLKSGNLIMNSNGAITGGTSSGYNWAINEDGTASFNQIYATGGKIGGSTITQDEIKSATSGWTINKSGSASFSNVTVTGGSITLGNTTINASSFKSGGFSTSGGSGGSGGTSTIYGNNTAVSGGTGQVSAATLQKWGEAIVTKYIHAEIAKIDLVHALGLSIDTSINIDPSTGKPSGVGARIGLTYGGLTLYNDTNLIVATSSGSVATGRTGTLTFSDGSYLQINKGIITYVGSGSSGSWSGD